MIIINAYSFEGVVLQMKSMNIDTIVNFPFPTAPDRPSLKKAEKVRSFPLQRGHAIADGMLAPGVPWRS